MSPPARRSAASAGASPARDSGRQSGDRRDRRRGARRRLGAVINNRQYYRDTRGYCYYVDQYGNPIYDYNTRC
jgi:hypothetical protein